MDENYEFVVEWDKIPIDFGSRWTNMMLKGIQKTVYLVITDQMTQLAGVTPRNLSRKERKEYKKDSHKAVSFPGTKKECEKYMSKFEQLKGSSMQEFWEKCKNKVTNNKFFRRLNSKYRKKINKSMKEKTDCKIEKLQNYLLMVGVRLDYGVNKLE